MSYPINYPTPEGANVQIFREGGTASDWVKPQGASFVWFTLIGSGGGGASNGGGGGSGAVTNFMCPAFLIPDILRINIGKGSVGGAANNFGTAGTNTTIVYQQKDGTGYTLLTANAGTGASGLAGGAATAANAFTAMGFYQSIAGQAGSNSTVALTASATTFLSGGSGYEASVTANYGYSLPATVRADPPLKGSSGFFMQQPIAIGIGGAGGARTLAAGDSGNGGDGGIGCGGGDGPVSNGGAYGTGGTGGDGLVIIITW